MFIEILKGLLSYIPGINRLALHSFGTGINISAKYYYAVWLKHLTLAERNSLPTHYQCVAEIGPGDTLGVCIAALLSGVNKCFAFDIFKFSNQKRNLRIFHDLVTLFKQREKIPDILKTCDFPDHILTEKLLARSLKADRLRAIEKAIINIGESNGAEIEILYFVPWYKPDIIKQNSVDLILSHAVLEHVDDLPHIYGASRAWLRPGGFVSHQIDFSCHQTGKIWNQHWSYSNFIWKFIKGKRTYLLNREPHSKHIKLLQKNNFKIVYNERITDSLGLPRERLAEQFKNLSDDDLLTKGAIIQAIKI